MSGLWDKFKRWLFRLRTLAKLLISVGVFLGVALITLLGFAGYNIVVGGVPGEVPYDLAIVLLSGASLALFSLSFLVAALTLVGWRQLQDHIADSIEAELEEVNTRHRGMLRLMIGFFLGRGARKETEDGIEVPEERREMLRSAINHTNKAVELLSGDEKQSLAVNNLAFYYALYGGEIYARKAPELAEKVLAAYYEEYETKYLTTYGRLVGAFPDKFDRETVEEAHRMLGELLEDESVSKLEKDNARRHLPGLRRALSLNGDSEEND